MKQLEAENDRVRSCANAPASTFCQYPQTTHCVCAGGWILVTTVDTQLRASLTAHSVETERYAHIQLCVLACAPHDLVSLVYPGFVRLAEKLLRTNADADQLRDELREAKRKLLRGDGSATTVREMKFQMDHMKRWA